MYAQLIILPALWAGQYNLMLAFAKYEMHHVNKSPSVFPPLIGSHRKIKIEYENKQSAIKNVSPTHRDHDEEENFLKRMKKARDLILSHQRSKKLLGKNDRKVIIQRSKTDNSERMYGRPVEKSFSQVVYNIYGSPTRRVNESQHFNDKILRECKSQFMPNEKQRHRVNKYHLNVPRKHNITQNSQIGKPKYLFGDENPPLKGQKGIKKLKAQDMEEKMMNILFPQNVIASNGQQLIQKLKKFREQKLNPEFVSEIKKEQNEKENEKERAEEVYTGRTDESGMQFPYYQSKKKDKVKSKFLARMKQANKKQKYQVTLQDKQQENIFRQQSGGKDSESQNEGNSLNIKKRQTQGRRQRQQLKNQSKSAYFDENFKLEAWNSKRQSQYQLF